MEKYTLSLESVNYGDHQVEEDVCDFFASFDGGFVELDGCSAQTSIVDRYENNSKNGHLQKFIKFQDSSKEFSSEIWFMEKDIITHTWEGLLDNGDYFRIVRPNPQILSLTGNTLTIASTYHDGFAVHFNLL